VRGARGRVTAGSGNRGVGGGPGAADGARTTYVLAESPKFTDVLPDWPPETVAILATAGEGPHAIPVSAAVRAGPRHALLGLAASRGSLARLRADPRVSLAIVSEAVAVTAYGRARVLDDEVATGVVAVEVEVERVADHDRPTFVIEAGVRWRWTDPDAGRRDAEVRAALQRLADRH